MHFSWGNVAAARVHGQLPNTPVTKRYNAAITAQRQGLRGTAGDVRISGACSIHMVGKENETPHRQ